MSDHHHHKKPCNAEDLKALIKDVGLSFTKPRHAILQILMEKHGPFSADEIHKLLPPKLCDLATVFRTLKQFKEKDLIKPVKFDEDFTRYEYNDPHHHHHHIICTECQKVETIEDCFLEQFEQKLKTLGFRQVSHSLEFQGLCPRCSKTSI